MCGQKFELYNMLLTYAPILIAAMIASSTDVPQDFKFNLPDPPIEVSCV